MQKKIKVIIPKMFKDIFDNKYNLFLFYGGRAGGKSFSVADCILFLAANSKQKVVVCRETKQSMRLSIFALYKSRIEYYDMPNWHVSDNYIKNIATSSEIIFIGLNDSQEQFIDSIRSIPDIDICVLEEAQNLSKQAIQVLFPTVRRNPHGSKIIALWNPQTVLDPIWDFVVNPRQNSLIQKVNYLDNIFCPTETLSEADDCKKYHPDEYNNVWLGNPRDLAANLVTKNFSIDNISDKIRYIDSIDLHLSCDFNRAAPMSWVIFHKDDDKIYYLDEIVAENTTTREAMEEFLLRYPSHKGKIVVNGDASSDYLSPSSEMTNYAQIRYLLRHHGYKDVDIKIKPKNPFITTRIDAWNNRIITLKGNRCILIHPRCKWLLYNIYNLKWKSGLSDKIDYPTDVQIKGNKELGYLSHIFDAASYPVEYYFPVTNQKLKQFTK